MGAHKHNQTAIAAKNGELPPKPKKIGKRAVERMIYEKYNEMTSAEVISKNIPNYF